MALYYYQGFSKDGKRVKGTVDASSLGTVRSQLSKMGIYPSDVHPVAEGTAVRFAFTQLFERRITTKDKVLFTKQLVVLLKAGVPLLQALELLIDQFEGRMRAVLISLKDGIKEGQSLAAGLSNYPNVFDNIYVQLVRAGEATGKLEVILERLTEYLERREEIARRVRSALRAPLFQLVFIMGVIIFLMVSVVPGIAQTFQEGDMKLPDTTTFMLSLSEFITNYYLVIIGGIALLVFLYLYWASTAAGALALDKIKLRLPVVRFFAKTSAVVQFSRTLGMLVEGGVNLAEALDIVVNIVQNRVLTQSLKQARDKIIKEGKIAPYLKQTGLFPPIAIYLINTGEQSGQLGFMLLTVAQTYETELQESSDSLSAKIGPIMLLITVGIVGFIIMAIMQPIGDLMNKAGVGL